MSRNYKAIIVVMINRNKQVITETCQPATHDTTDKKERTVWSGLVWLPDIEVR